MKKAIDYLHNLNVRINHGENASWIEAIQQAQKEAYNQALEDAVETASCEYEKDYLTGEIDKESILKLKK